MKRFIGFIAAILCLIPAFRVSATEEGALYPYDIPSGSFWFEAASAEYSDEKSDAKALLLMEYSTGKILFQKNETQHLPIASVTKVMSTLLIMEALDSNRITLQDMVSVSELAASMGGSQVFLEPGEEMSVEDLLKALIVSSANDATLALAEFVCGSETAFVQAMNDRARELGCENTNFVNTNGLPAENHYSCALDVAIITRELMKHERVFDYTTIWMDTIRNGSFGLSNTNKLIKFYKGATGMKTGYTDEAKYCVSATAERNGLHLIAVVLGSETSDNRFASAKRMFDFGFANYSVISPEIPNLEPIKITRGVEKAANLYANPITILTEKGNGKSIETKIVLEESIKAPFGANIEVGYISYLTEGKEIARAKIFTKEGATEVSYFSILGGLFDKMLFK